MDGAAEGLRDQAIAATAGAAGAAVVFVGAGLTLSWESEADSAAARIAVSGAAGMESTEREAGEWWWSATLWLSR
jgi:hypothetical protein